MSKKLTWLLAPVGCYWHSTTGGFYISTVHDLGTGESWYVLTRRFKELGRYDTLDAAKKAAATVADADSP